MKKIKSTVALVLALIMAFSAFPCASAAPASASSDASIAKAVDTLADAAEESGTHANCHNGDCGHAPVVVVPGINHSPTYLYDENDEPYTWYICYVTLENFNLSHLPIYIMGEDQLSRYALYMSALGNRPDLFPSSPYVAKYTADPVEHEIPEAYLADETFAAILSEAEKYIGYPYVWGGSSPATSFDCSGYVSWVINHSGWNVGRLGAQGLYNICTPTSSPRPGDLVFFKGTYDTPGVSHCGIYVGDGRMLHCGDPIGYANLNTSYWQSHFYAYGRLP